MWTHRWGQVSEVILRNVTFSHRTDSGLLLPTVENVNIEIAKGSKVAIVGRSGSGKSTIVDLLSGFYLPDSGDVFINGIALSAETIAAVRERTGVVFQDTFLFNTTIEENLRAFTRPGEGVDLTRALRLACLSSVVEDCPEGIHTQVGENGALFSGGERQRLGIARALCVGVARLDSNASVSDPDPW